MQNFRFELDADGVALITWDMPGRSMNVLTVEVIEELTALVDKIAGDAAIKGAVVTSGKESFSGGADLTMLQGMGRDYARVAKAEGEEAAMRVFFDRSRQLSLTYRKLETCGKPFAAAINGVCLGGAFELALACHYRIVADNDKARVGLPEIKVGLFPGAGGTQRVSRLAPTPDALQMMFRGELLRPAAAKGMGLVHQVAPAGEIVALAKAWVKANPNAKAPWDDPKFKNPSGKVFSASGMMIWPPANAIYRRETYDNYPAAKAILSSVFEGLQLPIDLALAVESRYFAKILRSKEAAAMIRSLFLSKGELDKGARRPAGVAPSDLAQDRRHRRRLDGRRDRLCLGERRARSRADRPRPGSGRQGQGAFGKADLQPDRQGPRQGRRARRAARAHPSKRRLWRAEGLRPRRRGGVRGPRGEEGGDAEGARRDRRRRDLRLQHLDPADRLARRDGAEAGEFHRHPLLLAGRQDDAGRDHRRRQDRPAGARDRDRFRARDPQDADRRQRLSQLLRQPLRWQLSARRPSDADGGRAARADRKRRAYGRHAGRAAVAQRRSGDRSCLAHPASDQERPWPHGGRSGAGKTARGDGDQGAAARAQERQGLLRLSGQWPQDTVARPESDRRQGARPRDDSACRPQGPRPLHPGAGGGALHGGKRRHRPARGRCRLDPRLRLRAVHRRRAVVHRRRSAQRRLSRAPRRWRPNTAHALRRAKG